MKNGISKIQQFFNQIRRKWQEENRHNIYYMNLYIFGTVTRLWQFVLKDFSLAETINKHVQRISYGIGKCYHISLHLQVLINIDA